MKERENETLASTTRYTSKKVNTQIKQNRTDTSPLAGHNTMRGPLSLSQTKPPIPNNAQAYSMSAAC